MNRSGGLIIRAAARSRLSRDSGSIFPLFPPPKRIPDTRIIPAALSYRRVAESEIRPKRDGVKGG